MGGSFEAGEVEEKLAVEVEEKLAVGVVGEA